MIRPHVRPLIRAFSDSALPAHDLLDDAINLLGVEPRHYWDFTQNRALFAGADVGPVASTPGWSATALNLSSRGMLLDGVSTASIASPGVDFPLSLWVEIERLTDTGASESIIQVDTNTITDRAILRVNTATDSSNSSMNSGGVSQGSVSSSQAIIVSTITKIAGRFSTNSIQVCQNGTLGTEDTLATVAATPTHLRFGMLADGTLPFLGYIRRAAVFNSALSDANLQTATS